MLLDMVLLLDILMLRSGLNDLREYGLSVAYVFGGSTVNVGPVSSMKPMLEPGATTGTMLSGGCTHLI